MAFNYSTLSAAIDEYTANTTWGRTTTQKDNIIRLAENRINNDIQVANFNTKTYSDVDRNGSIVQGDSSISIPDSGYGIAIAAVEAPMSPLYFKLRAATIKDCATTSTNTTVTMADTTGIDVGATVDGDGCLLYTSPSPRD